MLVTSKEILHPDISSENSARQVILIASALCLIALLDHGTGDFPLQHLYYLPIIFAGITFGRRGALMVAFASVVLYHVANPALFRIRHGHFDFVQVALFLIVGIVSAKLTDDAKRMHLLALTDDLTGLHNLRSFESRLAAFVNQARLYKTPLSLLVLDLDRLKSINDSFGHLAGAEAVRTVGHLIASHIPSTAVACRYGGDEFVIALPEYTVEQAVKFAETLRQTVYDAEPTLVSRPFPAGTLSISIGVAGHIVCETGDTALEAEALFRAADQASYRAKEEGRNMVCAIEEDRSLHESTLQCSGGQ
jgi:diguanylate cyclase (GGDEF)-like protein